MDRDLIDGPDRDARCGASLYADKKGQYKILGCNSALVSITLPQTDSPCRKNSW